ncbi:MAG: tRNA lysidine(34) synthetase TilS [Pseudomonadota bacterium]
MTDLNPLNLFENLSAKDPVLVAVSGGSDSIALLLLASAWAQHSGAAIQLVTVDHGLRPEAAAEAAFVAGVSEGLGCQHVTLAWDGVKPSSGVSDAARNARYRLMEEYARDIGVDIILTGHTANDQAETVYMRNLREGDSLQMRGLSGMAPEVLLPNGVRLLRPLLDVTRNQLREYLLENQQSWIEDPSNLDKSYERVRVRDALGDDEEHIAEICRFARINGRERRLVSSAAGLLLSDKLSIFAGPVYSVPNTVLENAAPPVAVLALQVMIALAGGAEHFASETKVHEFLSDQSLKRLTLGNSVIDKAGENIRMFREKRNLPSLLIAPGDEVCWDGRLNIINDSPTTYFCGPLDAARIAEIEGLLDRKLPVKPRAVLDSSPFLCGDGDDVYLPFAKGFGKPANVDISLACKAIRHFCPIFDKPLLEVVGRVDQLVKGAKLEKP